MEIPFSEISLIFDNKSLKGISINKAIKNFELASLELINQSNTNDRDKTINAFRNLAGTCKGCHQKFRN